MYYFVHLSLPALVVLAMAIAGTPPEMSISGLEQALEHFAQGYMMLSLPHWIWAAVSAYFDTSKSPTVGGFMGLHLLLVVIALLIFMQPAPESANAWFIYYLGAPIVITLGALLGSYITSWKNSK